MHYKKAGAHLSVLAGWAVVCFACLGIMPNAFGQPEVGTTCAIESAGELPGMSEARELEQTGQFAESIGKYSEALEALRQSCGEYHPFATTVLSSRAMMKTELGQYPEAKEDLGLAETIARSLTPKQPLLLARVLYTRGNLLMRLDELAGAEADLQKVLDVLASEADVPIGYINRTRSTLAGVYYMMGQPQKALNEFLPVVEAYRSNPTFPELANSLGNLGEIYRATGDLDLAARYFKESIDVYDAQGGVGHIGSALPMNNLALTFLFRGDIEQAERHLTRAL